MDARDGTSKRVFKANKNQTAENKYNTVPHDCVILGTYANKSQYINLMYNQNLEASMSLHDSIHTVEDSSSFIEGKSEYIK